MCLIGQVHRKKRKRKEERIETETDGIHSVRNKISSKASIESLSEDTAAMKPVQMDVLNFIYRGCLKKIAVLICFVIMY